MSPKIPNWQQKGLKYYSYRHYLEERFNTRVHRVSIDAGFTCPNVDGTVAFGGCIFCDNRSFTPAHKLKRLSVFQQIDEQCEKLDRRYRSESYLAYFQAATNTYDSIENLQSLYDEAVSHPRVKGLIVSTRPDALSERVYDLLDRYAERMYVSLEIGLQSIHERSLAWMNRGHNAASFHAAVAMAKNRKFDIAVHVILGLPGESKEDMLATADALARSGIQAVKIHNLHVVHHTPLALQFRKGAVKIMEQDDYLDTVIAFIEHLPPHMVIQRVVGDAPDKNLIAPLWSKNKQGFLRELDAQMSQRQTWQGRCYIG